MRPQLFNIKFMAGQEGPKNTKNSQSMKFEDFGVLARKYTDDVNLFREFCLEIFLANQVTGILNIEFLWNGMIESVFFVWGFSDVIGTF